MGKTYEKAPASVGKMAEKVMKSCHSDLHKQGVTIDFVFANNENGPAVSHGGYPAAAVCRILGLKDRALGRADAEITIDQSDWDAMSEAQQEALLDHEITHLTLARDSKTDEIRFDDLNRPRLKMKKHDFHFGWFESVARRHGRDSIEVYQARKMWTDAGQAFWPDLLATNGMAAPTPEKKKKAAVKARKAATEIEDKLNKALKKSGVTARVRIKGKLPATHGGDAA
jgi:hypothetical protein